VRVVAAGGVSDYFDAITLANKICERPGFISEGGAKNAARRDGMGTTVLSAVGLSGAIPDWYVQAIGSGTGAIAAHEANIRLNASGAFPVHNMRLLLTQNSPFTPVADAWEQKSRTMPPYEEEEAKRLIDQIDAKVLSNRSPPYGIAGGLYDALCASSGEVNTVTNKELQAARAMFEECEGCDICPEAGAAIAALMKALKEGQINKDALIMLNITGGGECGIRRDLNPQIISPSFVIENGSIGRNDAIDELCLKLRENRRELS